MLNVKVFLWEKYCKLILIMEFFLIIFEKEIMFEFCYNEQSIFLGKIKSFFKSIILISIWFFWSSLDLKICYICMLLKEK